MVWTIDEIHAPLFWFPRRVSADHVLVEDGGPADRLGTTDVPWCTPSRNGGSSGCAPASCTSTGSIHGTSRWWPDADGYGVSAEEQQPLDVDRTGDLLDLHLAAGIELRVPASLQALRDEVIVSGYRFSMCRMHNARP